MRAVYYINVFRANSHYETYYKCIDAFCIRRYARRRLSPSRSCIIIKYRHFSRSPLPLPTMTFASRGYSISQQLQIYSPRHVVHEKGKHHIIIIVLYSMGFFHFFFFSCPYRNVCAGARSGTESQAATVCPTESAAEPTFGQRHQVTRSRYVRKHDIIIKTLCVLT